MTINDTVNKTFHDEMKAKGYCLQTEQDKEGMRFVYYIPQPLWMDSRIQTPSGKEPITQVFTKINPELVKHVGDFYKQARATANKIGHQITFTEPTPATEGTMVIYVWMKYSDGKDLHY